MATSFSTIDTTIRRALLGEGDEGKKRWVRAFVHARRWYETEYAGGVEKAYGNKSEWLHVGPDRVADLPTDYVEWNMVGVRVGEQVRNLLHNARLVAVPGLDAPLSTASSAGPEPAAGQPDYVYRYADVGGDGVDLLGIGRPRLREGEFVIDRASRTLRVSSAVSPGQLLCLSYLSEDAPCGESTLIHQLAEPWLEFYILHFLNLGRNPAAAADYERKAERARTDYLLKRSPFQLEDLYAAMRNTLAQPV